MEQINTYGTDKTLMEQINRIDKPLSEQMNTNVTKYKKMKRNIMKHKINQMKRSVTFRKLDLIK